VPFFLLQLQHESDVIEVAARCPSIGALAGCVVAIFLAVESPVVQAAEMQQKSGQAAPSPRGNCQSDCQWNSIRCSSDCSMSDDASHFSCDRNCATGKSKCIERCSRLEGLSRVADADQRPEVDLRCANGAGRSSRGSRSEEISSWRQYVVRPSASLAAHQKVSIRANETDDQGSK
jgi:hypothetical protein